MRVAGVRWSGVPKRRAKMPMPRVWSPWSWVMRSAVMDSGSTSTASIRRARSLPLNPASTRSRVSPASTRMALPRLPLPRTVTLMARKVGRGGGRVNGPARTLRGRYRAERPRRLQQRRWRSVSSTSRRDMTVRAVSRNGAAS
jgi:hypothetical protein